MLLSLGCQPAVKNEVAIDGSSTVYLISEAVCEEFAGANPDVEVSVGSHGTGGGMKKFSAGELDICDASREMKPSEAQLCEEAGIESIRLSVAYDGIAVVVNPENDWCDSLTVEQLKELWRPESPIKNWSDLDKSWPDEPIKLYGPGTDSGTFEYFTEVVVGEAGASRSDYSPNEDDNMLVTGVAGDKYSLGYFGFAYYAENEERLKLLGIDSGSGPVKPSLETVRSNAYAPLSRPLFIYVKKQSLSRPEVAKFVSYYAENAARLSQEVGYVPAPEATHAENLAAIKAALADKPQTTP
ncbi:Phosphate-binding protein PstS precursor [Pirellulimonas nuda]|uniref:Phosphate-binding protein n=1 Tax=Pirellulimonas nuda TaxID=2528009 RepID=A0A518D7K6_9BACT|nr:Phosphate-binding protein PstS precursor [Pirellulimonas nuda]